jgi:hypothetical protein
VAHEREEYGLDAKGQRTPIGQTFDCWDKLEYELDLALRVVKAGKNRNAFVRKTRLVEFEEGSSFPWSYAEFAARYGEDTIVREVEVLDLATPEQINEIRKIFETKKIPSDLEGKWFLKANVSGWDEMSRDRVSAAIKYLNQTY